MMAAIFERADAVLARTSATGASAGPSSSTSTSRRVETGFTGLDTRIASLLHPTQHPSASASTSSSSRHSTPRIVEIAGPTASGKSAFIVCCAVRERLRTLFEAWEALSVDGGGSKSDKGKQKQKRRQRMTWDEWENDVQQNASQVMLIDTEGSCTPERLLTAAQALIKSDVDLLELARLIPRDDDDGEALNIFGKDGQVEQSIDEMTLPLVQAVLEGIQLCQPATRAQFLATIFLIDPHLSNGLRKTIARSSDASTADDDPAPSSLALPTGKPQSQAQLQQQRHQQQLANYSSLPARTSLLLIDTLSAFFRSFPSTKPEREERTHILSALSALVGRIRRYNQACVNQGRAGQVINLVVTNQMGVRMAPQDGSLANFEPGNSLPDKVAVLVPQFQIITSSSSTMLFGDSSNKPYSQIGHSSQAPWQNQATQRKSSSSNNQGEDASASLIGSGFNASVLGNEVWRVVLFRAGGRGHRFVQLYQLPRSIEANVVQSEAPEWKRWIHFKIESSSGLPLDPT
ncbi:hypothetical protein V8E36_006982 [Tilletia maclaganii]